MAWVERLREAMDQKGMHERWNRHGLSLFEAARYHFLFGMAEWEHRLWALNEINTRWEPDRLYWVSRPNYSLDQKWIETLLRAGSMQGLQIHYVGRPPMYSRARDMLHRFSPTLLPMADKARRIKQALSMAKSPVSLNHGRPLVFTENFPNSVKASFPVAQLLEKESDLIWIAAQKPVRQALSTLGVNSYLLDNHVSMGAVLRSSPSRQERRFINDVTKDLPAGILSGSHLSSTCVWPDFAKIIKRQLRKSASQAVRWLEAYYDLFRRMRPKMVVSTTYNSMAGRAAALAAQSCGGKAVYIQHGLLPARYVFSFYCNDKMLVWGDSDKRGLMRFGHGENKIDVTGATIYDDLIRRSRSNGDLQFPKAGEPLRIVFMASRSGGLVSSLEVSRETIRAAAEAARSIPRAHLTVKVHPADSTTIPEDVMSDYPEFSLMRGGNSQELILKSDLVIVTSSTTGFEGCLSGRPLVVLNLTGMPDTLGFSAYGAAILVAKKEDLVLTMLRLQEDQNQQKRLSDGRSRLISDMLNGGQGHGAEVAVESITRAMTIHVSPGT